MNIPCFSMMKNKKIGKMPQAGLEPARCYPLPPQGSVSANSTTAAYMPTALQVAKSTEES